MKFIYNSILFIVTLLNIFNMANAQKIYECVQNNTIALTYDDGPFEFSKQLVDYLTTKPDVKVTFFAVGKFHYPFAIDTQEYQDVMKKAHDVGYQIASHTFEHKLYINDTDLMRDALTKQDDFIEKVTGDRPKYFRAPKGDCGEECQSTLESWGYKTIQWDTDTLDWDLEGAGSQEKRAEESIQYLQSEFAKEKSSYLILMHDTENATVSDITPWIIEKSGMKEKGYRFVTVAECLGDKNGMYVSGKVYGDEEEKKKEEAKIKSEEIAKTAAIHSGVEYSTKLTSFITLIVAITFISLIY